MNYSSLIILGIIILIIICIILCKITLSNKSYKIRVFMYFGESEELCLKSYGNSIESIKLDMENMICTNIDRIRKVQNSLAPFSFIVKSKNKDKEEYYYKDIYSYIKDNKYLKNLERALITK